MEKLLVTSNFSFSRRVFKRLVLQTCKNQGLFGKGVCNGRSLLLYLSRFSIKSTYNNLERIIYCQAVNIFLFYPFPKTNPVYSTNLLKTLWEKEKLPVSSNFSFSHSVFLPVWRTFFHFNQV